MSQANELTNFFVDWLIGLLEEIKKSDRDLNPIFKRFSKIKTESPKLEHINSVWLNITDLVDLRKELNNKFNQISDFESKLQDYLTRVLDIIFHYINTNEDLRNKTIFRGTGKMCASQHAVEIFEKANINSNTMKKFLANLNSSFGIPNMFEVKDEKHIIVTYPKCFCPLVNSQLVDNPELCNCSSEWLNYNFSESLKKKINIVREGTVLEGKDKCRFIIEIEN